MGDNRDFGSGNSSLVKAYNDGSDVSLSHETGQELEIFNSDIKYETDISFRDLGIKPEILRGLSDCSIFKPSVVQSTVLGCIFGNAPRNIVAQSQTGTGKSVAYVIAILQSLDLRQQATQALVLTPTHELSKQIYDNLLKIGKYCNGLTCELAIKDSSPKNVPNTAAVVVGCCGTVIRWLKTPGWLDLNSCGIFVVDEADNILQQDGQFSQLSKIRNDFDCPCLHLFFSATFSDEVITTTSNLLMNPMCIRLRRDELPLKNITQFCMRVKDDNEKIQVVSSIYNKIIVSKTIVFCNKRTSTNQLALKLQAMRLPLVVLTGDMPMIDRASTFSKFRNNDTDRILISTDICARGIDIRAVNLVINFDIPLNEYSLPNCDMYYHRIGRGGRFGDKSASLIFFSSDIEMNYIDYISKYYNHQINEVNLHNEADAAMFEKTLIR